MKIKEDNKDEEKHLVLSEVTTRILGWYCMWPKESLTPIYLIKFGLVLLSLYIVTFGLIGHLKHYLDYNPFNYLHIADDVAGIASSNSVIYLFSNFILNQNSAREILRALGDFSRFEKPEGIEKVKNHLNFLATIFGVWLYLSMGAVWVLCFIQHCEDGDESDCGLVISAYLPIDIFRSPHRTIFMTLQTYSAFSSGVCAFYIAWLYLNISEYVVVWLNHLKNLIRVVKTLKGRRARKAQIKKCVQYQHYILEISEKYNGSVKNIFIVHVTNSAVVMSMILYQLLCNFLYVNFVHLCAWLAAVIISCVYGERLISESLDLAPVVYNSFPDDGDLETKRDMLLILMRSQKELNIPCGKFGCLSHLRLMAILKAMYSFVTLLAKTM